MIEKQTSRQIKDIRTDNGLEYCNEPYVYNRTSSRILEYFKCPEEVYDGKKPNLKLKFLVLIKSICTSINTISPHF
uniref:Integrase catalytic domain-containing protein n=1 Tax=Megaselia scalaris TaxID=36166 RepID=T1GU85_MEGSC